VSETKRLKTSAIFGTFEPLLAGDRQKKKRVAKARNPLQKRSFEVSLS
jgi:hypothetical protein